MDDYITEYIPKHKNLMNNLFHLSGHVYQFVFFPKELIIYNVLFSYMITILQKEYYFSDNYFHLLNISLIKQLFNIDFADVVMFYSVPFKG